MNRRQPPPGSWRVLGPALGLWAVTAWAVTAPGAARVITMLSLALGGSVVLGACLLRRRPRQLVGVTLISLAALVCVSVQISAAEHARDAPLLAQSSSQSRTLGFDARLTGFIKTSRSPIGERYWVRAEAQTPLGGVPVLLWLAETPSHEMLGTWAPGRNVSVLGQAERFAPGSDAAYGVSVVSIQASPVHSPVARFGAWAAELRFGLRMAAADVPGAALVPGFAVGETALVSPELEAAMLASSLTHLVAVSGANCALVTGAAIWLMGRAGVGRRWRILTGAGCLALFVGVVGPDASVQRAAVMAAVMLVSGFGGKGAASLPSLGVAVLVLLIANPWQSLQPGFALSVAATGGILLLASPLSRWLTRRARVPRFLALPIAIALAAQVACGPLLLLLQPDIPAVGVLANVFAAPAAPLGTGIGLLALLCLPLSPVIGEWPGHALVLLASLPARWVEATAQVAQGLPLARWHWPDGWGGFALLVLCQTALLAAWGFRHGYLGLPGGLRAARRPPWQPAPPLPVPIARVVSLLLATSLGIATATIIAVPYAERVGTPRGWAVVACDVGQGDAILLRDPGDPGRVMLVDTGDDADKLVKCLESFRVGRITLLVLTHDDRDHVGALSAVIDRVDAALISQTVRGERQEARSVVRQLTDARVPFRVPQQGEARQLQSQGAPAAAGLGWHVLGPGGGAPLSSNAASLVMLVTITSSSSSPAEPISVLLLGDTGVDEQRRLLSEYGPGLRADILKVSHHGSKDQDHTLPEAVRADWALLSVGAENRYGHPATETLASLARGGTRVLRTDLHGAIALLPRAAGELEAWVERSGRAQLAVVSDIETQIETRQQGESRQSGK